MSSPSINIVEPEISEVPQTVPHVATGSNADNHMAEATGQGTEPQCPQPRSTKKRGQRSDIWKIFTMNPIDDTKAICNYCKKVYVYETKNGTSSLWHHANQCVKNPNKKANKNQPMLTFEKKKEGTGGTLKSHTFNFEKCRKALAEMVIIDEYPFRMVEGQGFVKYTNCLEPRFVLPSRWTVARDCIKVYKEEKKKLKSVIKGKRISMTTDCWTSNQKINYMCLTAHWIGDDWILQKKILNFRQVVSHKGFVLGKVIEKCLLEWGIDNILSLTVDNATSNNDLVKYLATKTKKWNSCIVENEFLHVRCAAHILNLVVRDGLEEEIASVEAIRNAVKYVRSSPARLDTFKRCVEIEKIKSKSLPSMDVDTRWNSTYLMLESSVDFEKAFERLEEEDKGYKTYFEKKTRGPPKKDDWAAARMFVQFLKLFYDCTISFSSSLSITSNLFFNEMLQVHDMIKWMISSSSDVTLTNMAKEMKNKYDKYWGNYNNINYLLFVSVILDPRYKMKYVEWNIKRLCDYDFGKSSYITSRVRETLDKLFRYYESINSRPNTSFMDNRGGAEEKETPTGLDMYAILMLERSRAYENDMMAEESDNNKSELEIYFLDRFDPQVKELDVLLWWKVNAVKYPILSKMACDVLAVPVSTVSSESAFSTGSRVIDNFRTSLLPKTVETLLCAQSWLKTPKQPVQLREMLLDLEKYEEIAQDLDEAVEAGEKDGI
ncbi:zinc finger BED domain-containing protein DAYSLEEPER-like [Apium graveolens]|uniref:zinc finger BED domain-containing protein DAYSLEEPER-like n=1 Tax=Apium graveolens TaxID=4045 RepID=UPI003D78FEB3